MWHACKQRAFALLGLQKYTANRTPFGVSKKEQSVKPRFQGHSKFIACYRFSGQDTQENWRRTCDGHSKNNYQHLHCQWLETLSWVGTALVFGINYKLCTKARSTAEKNECQTVPCICKAKDLLFRLALSMPKTFAQTKRNALSLNASLQSLPTESNDAKNYSQRHCLHTDVSTVETSSQALEDTTRDYFAELENLAGLELITIDSSKAFTHFLSASALGSTKGHFNVGICYETGQGTNVDFKKAAHHYAKAADAGHSFATYNLGLYYMEGRDGIEEQPDMGLTFLTKASEFGVADAQYYLGICYQEGWKVEKDVDIARELLQKAATSGHRDAIKVVDDWSKLKEDAIDEEIKFSFEPPMEDAANEFAPDKELECSPENIQESPTTFHVSVSSPDLCHESAKFNVSNKALRSYEIAISRYLDVILPYHWIPEHSDDVNVKSAEAACISQVPPKNVMTLCLGM